MEAWAPRKGVGGPFRRVPPQTALSSLPSSQCAQGPHSAFGDSFLMFLIFFLYLDRKDELFKSKMQ